MTHPHRSCGFGHARAAQIDPIPSIRSHGCAISVVGVVRVDHWPWPKRLSEMLRQMTAGGYQILSANSLGARGRQHGKFEPSAGEFAILVSCVQYSADGMSEELPIRHESGMRAGLVGCVRDVFAYDVHHSTSFDPVFDFK